MLGFRDFLTEAKQVQDDEDSKQQNKRGVLHELLVGRALRGGEHMTLHPDQHGMSPQQVHDAYASELYGDNFNQHPSYLDEVAKANRSADAIMAHSGKPVHEIFWTSKAGDIAKATGRDNSQEQDTSDIYVDHGPHINDPRERFTGVSLKTVEKKNGKAPVSNSGREKEDNKLGVDTSDIVSNARMNLRAAHPGFRVAETAAQAKAVRKSDPVAYKLEAGERDKMLKAIAARHAEGYNALDKKALVGHLRTMMRAHDTGHGHVRLTTGGQNGDFTTKVETPHLDHEHIFSDPKNITAEAKGNSVVFKHHGKTFFKHRMKAAGSAGVFGSIKISGEH